MSSTVFGAIRLVLAHTSSRALSYLQRISTKHPRSRSHAVTRLHARAQQSQGMQTLTFGFTFFGVLLILLLSAHFIQRYANRRQREFRARVLALREAREAAKECKPRIWDVYVRPESVSSSGSAGRSENERMKEEVRWVDIQPLSAYVVPPPLPSDSYLDLLSAEAQGPIHLPLSLLPLPPTRNLFNQPHTRSAAPPPVTTIDSDSETWGRDRPLNVSVIISMPSPPVEKPKHDYDSEGEGEPESVFEYTCYELGVAKIH